MQVPGTVRTGREQRGEELLGPFGEINQVFALVGRAGAERQNGESVRTRRRLGLDIARIDGAQPHIGREHAVETGDGDEEPVVGARRWQGVASLRAGGTVAVSEARPGGVAAKARETQVDPIVRAGMALHRGADRTPAAR